MKFNIALLCSELLTAIEIPFINIELIQVATTTAVQWQRDTDPVFFGKKLKLTCMVGKKEGCDSKTTRRWNGGPDRNILLLNGLSSNASKYYEVTEEPCENFSLIIMQLGINDVNCEYWCSFGFETSRQMLELDDRHFIEVPKNIKINAEQNMQNELNLNISFCKVYPKPRCQIKIKDRPWVNGTSVSNPVGSFFNSTIHYKTVIEPCHDNVTTVCKLLSLTVHQFNTRLNCTDAEINQGSHTMSVIATLILIPAVFFILFGCLYQYLRKKQQNQRRASIITLRMYERDARLSE